jgi:hypothetical protein
VKLAIGATWRLATYLLVTEEIFGKEFPQVLWGAAAQKKIAETLSWKRP